MGRKDLADHFDELVERVEENHEEASIVEDVIGVTTVKDAVDVVDVGIDVVTDTIGSLFDW
jgi:hypothetical protein